jgi:hypothetical protein
MCCKLFWQIVRRTYPWLPLAITLWRIACLTGDDRLRAQVRFWKLYSRIQFAELLAMAIDLAQPEFWV